MISSFSDAAAAIARFNRTATVHRVHVAWHFRIDLAVSQRFTVSLCSSRLPIITSRRRIFFSLFFPFSKVLRLNSFFFILSLRAVYASVRGFTLLSARVCTQSRKHETDI